MNEPQYFAIIPAAGSGSRMQRKLPKQYLLLEGQTILAHTLSRLSDAHIFQHMVLVLSPHDTQGTVIAHDVDHLSIVTGGEHRVDSVRNGLKALNNIASPNDWVFVHDAARPLISVEDILLLKDTIKDDPVGGILGFPIADTLKKCDNAGNIINTVSRENLWAAQTPQAFRYHVLCQALADETLIFTDEAAAVEQLGLSVKMVMGSASNIKITHPHDLSLANCFLKENV